MYSVAVIGAAGFAGAETARLLLAHPEFDVVALSSDSDEAQPLSSVYPYFEGRTELRFVSHETILTYQKSELDAVFLAAPHTVGMQMAPKLLAKGINVIDLSADFRLHKARVYEKWYGVPHTAPELLPQAVYGLPELNRSALKAQAQRLSANETALIANPGCYPTASVLAALPVIKAGLMDVDEIVVINAISGVSGAGRTATETTHYCLADESVHAYGVATHRHTPEIVQTLSHIADRKVDIQFTPHLAPLSRGMVATVTMRLSKTAAAKASALSIWQLYVDSYANEPFVRVLPQDTMPKCGSVKHSNYAHIGVAYDEYTRMVVASAAIDNLGKGAASQAVQCANILFSLDESTGLVHEGVLL